MPGSDLKYAVSDAKRVASTVQGGAHYAGVKVETLVNQAASPDAIRARLDDIVKRAQHRRYDRAGFRGSRACWIPTAASGSHCRRRQRRRSKTPRSISTEIASRVAKAQARAVVLLDVCHAGASGQINVASKR